MREKMGCVASRDAEGSDKGEKKSWTKNWQCASSRKRSSKTRSKKRRKKRRRRRRKTQKGSSRSGDRKMEQKSEEAPRTKDALRWKDVSDPEPSSSASVRSKDGEKMAEKRSSKKNSHISKSSDAESSAGPSSSTGRSKKKSEIPREAPIQRRKSDENSEEPSFPAPQEVFTVDEKTIDPGSHSSMKKTKSLHSKSSNTSDKSSKSKKSEGPSQPAVSRKASKDRKPADLRPSISGCAGKCSQQRSKIISQELEERRSVKRSSNKCHRSSGVRIEFCEPAPRIKKSGPSGEATNDAEVNQFARMTDEVFTRIKKNCQRFKGKVLPVVKKKSKTALRKIKEGCKHLSESEFFAVRRNCDLQDCGSGTSDCTSRTSTRIGEKSSEANVSGSEKPHIDSAKTSKNKSQKPTRSKSTKFGIENVQICECEDNPKKESNDKFYSPCYCTEKDPSGNELKKGCC